MKKNILPNMQTVTMTDRNGEAFAMSLELRRIGEKSYLFLSDTHQLGASRLAQDAMFYLEKITKALGLQADKTVFYRHIFQEQMGSLFGRFMVDWANAKGPSYKFTMLTNIEDLVGVKNILAQSESVVVAKLAAKQSRAEVAA